MARGTTPPPPPDPIRLPSNSAWFDIPQIVLNQRRRQRHPSRRIPTQRETVGYLDAAIQRNPNASQPITTPQNNPANLPALPTMTGPPQATGSGGGGGGLPPTRLNQQMIQAYLNMLMGRRR